MELLSALASLVVLGMTIGLIVYVFVLASRLVHAHKRSALALDRISRALDQVAQSGNAGARSDVQ